MNDRLYRSRDDRVIGGVCAGLAERLDLDPSLVRIGWVILTILTGGLLILLYIVMLIVVPEGPAPGATWSATTPEPGAVPGWTPPAAGAAWMASTPPRPGDAPAPAGPGAAQPAPPATSGAGEVPPAGEPGAVPGWTAPSAAQVGAASAAPGMPGTPGAPGAAPGWTAPSDARAARRAARRERRANADPTLGLIFGALLVLLGVYFLAAQYLPDLDLGRFWPVIVILLGVLLVVRAFWRPRPDA